MPLAVRLPAGKDLLAWDTKKEKGKKGAPVAGAAARFKGGGSGEERGRSGVEDAVLERLLLLLRSPLLLLLQQKQKS